MAQNFNTIATLIVFLIVLCVCVGGIYLSCDNVDPVQPSNLTCTCKHTSGMGILWYKNNKYMTDCFLKLEICLGYTGSFIVKSVAKEYKFSKDFYNYSSCDVYTCRDMYQPEVNVSQRIAVQDSTSISALNIIEPTTNHTSGFIGVTTECIYGASSEVTDLNIQWLVVMGSVEKSFKPVKTTIKTHNGSCQLCDGDKATQFHIGFEHKDDMECQAKEAKFRIILRHKGISSEPLNITTRNFYCVSDQTVDGSTSRCSIITTIVDVINGCYLLQYIVLIFMYIHKHRKRNTNPAGDESACFLVRRNPGMKGNHDKSIEMKGFIATDNKEGKMRSDSTKLERLQYWFLLLAIVPVLGIIGIIADIYTCCSGTDTERTSLSDQTEDGSTSMRSIIRTSQIIISGCFLLQNIVLLLIYIRMKRNTNPTGKMKSDSTKLIRLQDWFLLLAHVPVLGIIGIIAFLCTCCSGTGTEGTPSSDVSAENEIPFIGLERKQPDNQKGCTSSPLLEDDLTKQNDSDEGYKTTSSPSPPADSQKGNKTLTVNLMYK